MRTPTVFRTRDTYSSSTPSGSNNPTNPPPTAQPPGGDYGYITPFPGRMLEFAAILYPARVAFRTFNIFSVPYMVDSGVRISQLVGPNPTTPVVATVTTRIRLLDRSNAVDQFSDEYTFQLGVDEVVLVEYNWDVSSYCVPNQFRDYLFFVEFSGVDDSYGWASPYSLYVDTPSAIAATPSCSFSRSSYDPSRLLATGMLG